MNDLLFDPSLWMPAAGFILAIAVAIYGNNRTNSRIRIGGLGLIGLVIVWCVVAYFVQTPREKCISRTYAILAAAEAGEWEKLKTLLDDQTTMQVSRLSMRGRSDIATHAETAAAGYGLKNVRVLSIETSVGIGTIDVSFRALLEGANVMPSDWRFEYETRPDGIILTRIVPIAIGKMSMDEVEQHVR